ncbi:hypothetical protein BaRGS_00003137 [Batillaria attramentaria]|uniref:Uncharacterized protein n=1 Tax=Batillaria attramentaria TaxID=370345 RepID=A0ABD0M2X2_9CAEN
MLSTQINRVYEPHSKRGGYGAPISVMPGCLPNVFHLSYYSIGYDTLSLRFRNIAQMKRVAVVGGWDKHAIKRNDIVGILVKAGRIPALAVFGCCCDGLWVQGKMCERCLVINPKVLYNYIGV